MTADPLKTWLGQQSKEKLIQLIEAQCELDGDFLNALQLKAAAGNPAKNMAQIKKTIHNAFWIEDFVDWREAASYASNLYPVFDTLKEMLQNGEAEAVKHIKKSKALAERFDRPNAFRAMLHKPKRNFMKYLAEAGL